jgi:hypothetical protein
MRAVSERCSLKRHPDKCIVKLNYRLNSSRACIDEENALPQYKETLYVGHKVSREKTNARGLPRRTGANGSGPFLLGNFATAIAALIVTVRGWRPVGTGAHSGKVQWPLLGTS